MLWYIQWQDFSIHWVVNYWPDGDKGLLGRVPWIEHWFISFQSVAKWIISTQCILECIKLSFHFVWSLEFFVASLVLKLCISHLCCMIFAHINTCIIIFFFRISMSLTSGCGRRSTTERRGLWKKKWNKWRLTTGSRRWVFHTYSLICSVDRTFLFVTWPVTGSCEWTLTAVLMQIF